MHSTKRARLHFVPVSSFPESSNPIVNDSRSFLQALALLQTGSVSSNELKRIQEHACQVLSKQQLTLEELAAVVNEIVTNLETMQQTLRCVVKNRPLPIALATLSNLRQMEIHAEYGTSVGKIGDFTSLRVLFWGHPSVNFLPASISRCTALELLAIGEGEMKNLPWGLGKLRRLSELTVLEHKLEDLPGDIEDCTNLKVLNLGKNSLKKVPRVVHQLTFLQTLDLHNNQIFEISLNFSRFISLISLNLCHNKLSTFPNLKCTALTSLNLEANPQIAAIASSITVLSTLRFLHLSKTGLRALPEEIGSLVCLETLDVSCNKLKTVPAGCSRLTNLQVLDLSQNKISSLSLAICRLPQLQRLEIQENPIQRFINPLPQSPDLSKD